MARKKRKQHVRIGLIVEDQYSDAYRTLIEKIVPGRVRGYPLRKKKTIPATGKLRAWIQEAQNKYDFVFVLADLDTPKHRKDPQYFIQLKRICDQEGAALLIVKRELESWILADVNCIARWKNKNRTLPVYHNTTHNPLDPKKEIVKLINLLEKGRRRRKTLTFLPQWTAEIVQKIEINEATLNKNSSLRCFHDLVKGCCAANGQQHFEEYPQEAHCDSP